MRRWRVGGAPAGVVLLALTCAQALTAVASLAAWAVSLGNAGNGFATAASFPNYPTSVVNDGAWAYHREEEPASSAATSAAADSSSGSSHPGTYNGAGNGPTTWWRFDENGGTTAGDSSGGANPGTVVGSPSWVTGPSGPALGFGGGTYVAGTSRAVHTDAAFSVAAWVYLNSTSVDGVVASQNGSTAFGFALGFDSTSQKFVFDMTNGDTSAPTVKEQNSRLVTAGTWWHLVGVYSGSQLLLYVDGALAGSATWTMPWDATGSLQVGRKLSGGAWTGHLNGRTDEVRVYQRVLSASEVTGLADGGLVAEWNFGEGSGTTAADSSPSANTGNLGTGAGAPTWAGGHAGSALSMTNAANGYLQSTGYGPNTRTAFSVAAWAYLSSASTSGTNRVVLSQAGSTTSGFWLSVDSSNRWDMTVPQTDVTGPVLDSVVSNAVASTNTWVHLVGVVDPSANSGSGSISLYVNGTLQTATSLHASRWIATGRLQVGRALYDGSYQYGWYGMVDSVHVYQRVLSQADVTSLFGDTDPSAGWTDPSLTLGVIGALQGTHQGLSGSTAAAFAGAADAYNNTSVSNPTTFTLECWFRVSGTSGGEILGLHQNATDDTGSHDRTLYVDSGGRLTFGTYLASAQTVRSAAAYNDGAWHHAAASLGPAGMRLYVDGALVASGGTTTAGNYTGFWRWGGGTLANMPNRPASDYLTGSIDEVAIYQVQLTDSQVRLHYQRNY